MASIDSIATQRNKNGKPEEYNFRSTEDIYRFTAYVLRGNSNARPVYASSRGFVDSADDPKIISEEMEAIQVLYKKENGLRIRGEIIKVDKDELGTDKLKEIKGIADGFSDYYMGRGYQSAYGIYDAGEQYVIRYAINTTSFADGSKYKHNHTSILEQEKECLATVMADVTGSELQTDRRFDFDMLEYSR